MTAAAAIPPSRPTWWRRALATFLAMTSVSSFAESTFDHRHQALTDLLSRNVQWNASGHTTVVDYASLRGEHTKLLDYLRSVSAVSRTDFDGWNKPQRLAFAINAYNAYTVELVLTKYPDLESIKELGGLFSSPWKQRFFTLFGQPHHLDDIEHGLIRGAADYDDPRIHFAVNCASVGCPALRPEAYRAEVLDAQLEDQTRRFLGDRSRNRADPKTATLVLSPIFKWYEEDFSRGLHGADSVEQFVAAYAGVLGLSLVETKALQSDEWSIDYGDYDWSLNRLR